MYLGAMDEPKQIHGRFPWGLLLITDDASNEAIPTWDETSAPVTSSRTALVVKVLHEVDGPVTVRVARQQSASEGVVMFYGAIDVPSGTLRVSDDATAAQAIRVDVAPGPVSLRIIGERRDSPTAIEVVLT
jgi:hypothetical protein